MPSRRDKHPSGRRATIGAREDDAVWFGGDRFEADVSPNRQFADVVDRKEWKRLILLDVEAMRELRDLTAELVEFMERSR